MNIFKIPVIGICFSISPALYSQPKPCIFNMHHSSEISFHFITRLENGTLILDGTTFLNNGGKTTAPPAAGLPIVIGTNLVVRERKVEHKGIKPIDHDYYAQYHFVYRDTIGNIQDVWTTSDRRWFQQVLNNGGETTAPTAASDPVGYLFNDNHHVLYRDTTGKIHDVFFDGSAWHAQQLNDGGLTGAPLAAGVPCVALFRGQIHVTYRDAAGNIQDVWYGDRWNAQRLNKGGLTSAPGAASDPASATYLDQFHVAYTDGEGCVQDVWFGSSWTQQTLNAGGHTSGPLAVGMPSVMVFDGAQYHVVYRDRDGTIHDAWFDKSTWCLQKLNNGGQTSGPAAASELATMAPTHWQYVGYMDAQGQLQVLSYHTDSKWNAEFKSLIYAPRK